MRTYEVWSVDRTQFRGEAKTLMAGGPLEAAEIFVAEYERGMADYPTATGGDEEVLVIERGMPLEAIHRIRVSGVQVPQYEAEFVHDPTSKGSVSSDFDILRALHSA